MVCAHLIGKQVRLNGYSTKLIEPLNSLTHSHPNSLDIHSSKNRVINNVHRDSLELIVQNLRETDTGEYKCTAKEAIGKIRIQQDNLN